jgi:DNA modification methylase
MIKLICGHSLTELKKLPDESVDCCITSPPYWALRDYGVSGQLGLEPTFQEYITKLCDIFDEVKRVLKKTGTCWANIGDTYNSHQGDPYKVGGFQGNAHRNNTQYGNSVAVKRGTNLLPDKSLCNIPARFSIEMQNRGWILRNEIIWYKRNCMPSSVKDRFTVDFEKIFFFTKNKKYWFEQQFENYKTFEDRPSGVVRNREYGYQGKYKVMPPIGGIKQTEGNDNPIYSGNQPDWKRGRNMRCVWDIPTMPYKDAHFAVFPEKLVEPMIKAGCPQYVCKKCGRAREKIWGKGNLIQTGGSDSAKLSDSKKFNLRNDNKKLFQYEVIDKGYTDCGCNAGFEGGIVLDPFSGSGTTLLVAQKLGRSGIGIDLNPEYIKMADKRLLPLLK